ncbi:MAG: aminopeptidase [Deltaproteobacteria bacterium]|nr:aminopeptidase [Deltaproteobacteria bacterium]
MQFDASLKNYAKLLVLHGLNVQKGQIVNVTAEVCHRDFAMLIAEEAYRAGSSYVNIDLIEPRLARSRILYSRAENLSYQPPYISAKYKQFVSDTAANIRIVGMEDPEILSDLDPKAVNAVRMGQYLAMKEYYREGIEKSAVHWTIAAGATERWAKRIFPKLTALDAKQALWNEIFKICRVDSGDYLQAWRKHNHVLQSRAKKLTELGIKQLHFTGPGTDLRVGLSSKAIFKGGGDMSPRGVEFEPNIPTEECFTTPDWRATEGFVRATRPFLVNGKLIKGLQMRFHKGEIAEFSADEGREVFDEYISSDAGGRRLGEVALVGIDSPVYQSGLVFEEILFDENAACHIAVGSSYKFCLREGARLSESELADLGANQSTVHTDIMISSDQVDVAVETYEGKSHLIISQGEWVEF